MADKTAKSTEDPSVEPGEEETPPTLLNADGEFVDEQPDNTVRFTGVSFATERIIRVNEWPKGVEPLEEDVSWNMANKYTVKKSLFKAPHLEILRADGSFSVK